MSEKETIRVVENLNGKDVEVIYRKGSPGRTREELDEMRARGEMAHIFKYCAKLDPRVYEAEPGVMCYQDVPMQLRDGTTIYSDIYRPSYAPGPVPALISWSMFGKHPSGGMTEWKLMGVGPGTVSPMTKFESADPAYWCRLGYAVCNVDPRGVGNSEGYVSNFGLQDGRDGYDYIEWLAEQGWCNGKISLFGNSGVAMTIYRIAAEQPPHLTCIACWEATGDMYRESVAPGGIDGSAYNEDILAGIACNTYIEDLPSMFKEHPLMDEYWESKIPRWENITVPAYICAGWVHIHLRGSFEAFRRIRSTKKWMRAHREFEWPDTYHRDNIEDLTKFYDRYLKGIRNGWEFTPRVRLDVMDAYGYDYASKRPEDRFPLKRTRYKKLYLDASNASASYEPATEESKVSYDPKTETTIFTHTFAEDTEITGYMKLHMWVESEGHDDMTLFPWVKKNGLDGKHIPVHSMNEPYRGAWGYMKVSHRELDPKWSTDFQPVQSHRKEEKLKPGEIVPVDIEFYPTSRFWHKGETLVLEIQGRFIESDWFEDSKTQFETDNGDGIHVIHTGGKYDSYLQIPVVPPKYQVGDYVYRG